MEALYYLSNTIRALSDTGDLLDTVAYLAASALRARRSYVLLVDRQFGDFLTDAGFGLEPLTVPDGTIRFGELPRRIMKAKNPLLFSNLSQEPAMADMAKTEKVSEVLGVPIRSRGRIVGAILVAGPTDEYFGDDDLYLLGVLANLAMPAIEESYYHESLIRDPLTDTYVYSYFYSVLGQQVSEASRYGRPLSLIVIDLDGFDKINCQYGYHRGDLFLKECVNRIQRMIRSADILGRLAGDEFALVLPNTDRAGAAILADRIRQEIASVRLSGAGEISTTATIGVAELTPEYGDAMALFETAVSALSEAKQRGGNQVGQ